MPTYSHSKISTFEQCKLKYKYKYVDKIKIEGGWGIEAFMGSMVHETFEKLYGDLQHQKLDTVEELIAYYNKKWQDEYNEDEIVIVKEHLTSDHYRKMGERFIIDYYEHYKPFDQTRTLGLETTDFLKLDDDHKYHVRIDRLAKNPDGTYEVHDYKTNSRLPSQEKIDEDRQLAMYAIWVKKRFTDADKVKLMWHFVAFDEELTSVRSDEDLENLKQEVLGKILDIERTTDYPSNVTALCGWCEYQEMCPEWKHKFSEQQSLHEFTGKSGKELVDEYVKVKKQIDEFSEKLDKLKRAIVQFSFKENVTAVFGTEKKARVSYSDRKGWPAKHSEERKELELVLKDLGLFDDVAELDATALTKKLEELDSEKQSKIKEFEKIKKVLRVTVSDA